MEAVSSHEPRPDSIITSEKPQSQITNQEEPQPQELASPDDGVVPTTKLQFLVIFVALVLAIFCVALDNTIIVTAIPRITDT